MGFNSMPDDTSTYGLEELGINPLICQLIEKLVVVQGIEGFFVIENLAKMVMTYPVFKYIYNMAKS